MAAFSSNVAGYRHLITSITEGIPIQQWAEILQHELEPKGYKISTNADPISEKEKSLYNVDDSRMRNVLGIVPIDYRKTIIDTAYSLIKHKLIKPYESKKSFSFQSFNKNT